MECEVEQGLRRPNQVASIIFVAQAVQYPHKFNLPIPLPKMIYSKNNFLTVYPVSILMYLRLNRIKTSADNEIPMTTQLTIPIPMAKYSDISSSCRGQLNANPDNNNRQLQQSKLTT
jgi:hypothetical protein